MVTSPETETALVQLRRQMAQFVVDEVLTLASQGEMPEVSERAVKAIENSVASGVANGIKQARTGDAAALATTIVDALAARWPDGPARNPADDVTNTTPPGPPENNMPPSGPDPAEALDALAQADLDAQNEAEERRRKRQALWTQVKPWIQFIVAAVLLFGFAWWLYSRSAQSDTRLADAVVKAEQVSAGFERTCKIKPALDGQLKLVLDNANYKSECLDPKLENRDRNPLCTTVDGLKKWQSEYLSSCP